MTQLLDEARFIAAANCNVLLTGESGTGTELIAHLIHDQSPRRQHRMLSLHCAGLPASRLDLALFGRLRNGADRTALLALADHGTLLLEDVGALTPQTQSKLLRALHGGGARPARGVDPCGVRIISTTTRELLDDVERRFDVDLFYRLNVAHLQVPALRARREDIPPLMSHYLAVMSEQFRLPLCRMHPRALAMLEIYDWPGNVRELCDAAQLLAVTYPGQIIAAEQLPAWILEPSRPPADAGAASASRPRAAAGSRAAAARPERRPASRSRADGVARSSPRRVAHVVPQTTGH